jgi:CspA family cold shock protein
LLFGRIGRIAVTFDLLLYWPTGLKRSLQDIAASGKGSARTVQRLQSRLSWRIFEEKKMVTGVVKFFNTQKGFGFIQPADGSKDVFVHISAVERAGMSTLNEGQKVTFDIVSERGKNAAANLQNA